jgi:hypothetical protein
VRVMVLFGKSSRIARCLAMSLFLFPSLVSAKPDVNASIHAALSEDGDVIEGVVSLSITNDTDAPLAAIPLLLYPNRFLEPNAGLDDRTIHWIYPGGESAGKMVIGDPLWNKAPTIRGEKERGVDTEVLVYLPRPLEPGSSGTLEVEFRTVIPERRGRFGRWNGVVSLGGGWFPRPLADLTGLDKSLPPNVIAAHVFLELPKKRGAVIDDQVFEWSAESQTVEAAGIENETVVLVVMDMMQVSRRQYDWGEALHVHRELEPNLPDWKDTRTEDQGIPGGLPKPGEFKYSSRVFEVVGHTAGLIRSIAPEYELPERLVLVEIPAWDRLVQIGPGPLLISDRIWRLIPFEKALWFHDLALARGVGAQLTWKSSARRQLIGRRFVASDIMGSYLSGQYTIEIHQQKRTMEDLVGFASFVPVIDNLLYAPQIPFREVYSQSIEEPDLLRDEPWHHMNQTPRGKRILGKLEDLVGKESADVFAASLIENGNDFDEMVGDVLGEDPAWFFDQWFHDYPLVNYHLGDIEETVLPDGRYRIRVEVEREGEVIVEPVTVRLVNENNVVKELVWPGHGGRGIVEWVSDAPIDKVEIDPHHRLVEAAELTPDHPLADNISPLSWRPPMITRLILWGDLTSGEPYADLSLQLRRRYDVTNSISFSAFYSPQSIGGHTSYYRYFGPKRTLNSRTWHAGPTLGIVRYLEPETDAGKALPPNTLFSATMGTLGVSIGRDSRSYFFDPRSGSSFWLSARYSVGQADDGHVVNVGSVAGRVFKLLSPSIRHTFAIYGGAAARVGDPAAAQLVTLSDRQLLRGFDVEETYGRVGLYVAAEYRHTLFDAAFIPAPLFSWFDRFQGVFFLAGGTTSQPANYDGIFDEERLFSEVGYGLRIHVLAFGIQQYIIGLDLAVPITPMNRKVFVEQTNGVDVYQNRSPYKIIFGITQTY